MDAQHEQHGGDPVADDIESRNPDSGDIVAGEQVLDEGHVAPDQDLGEDAGSGSAKGDPDRPRVNEQGSLPDQDAGPSRVDSNRPEQPAEGSTDVGGV